MPRKRKNERADGRIQIPLDIGRDADGKRLRKYFYGATRAEAATVFMRLDATIRNL